MAITVFLDRDGVINEDSPDYIKVPQEFRFIPKSPEAVALLNAHALDVFLITNQAMIGRGISTLENLNGILDKMTAGVAAAGGRFRDIFYCPHHPDENCGCRKPKPGMLLQAAQRHGLDLSQAVMVGDSAKDILCARNGGCAKTVLVATGNGEAAYKTLCEQGVPPDFFAKDLFSAAQWIIGRSGLSIPDVP